MHSLGDVMSSQVKKRSWWVRHNWWLSKIWVRVGVLFLALLVGLISAKYASPWLLCWFDSVAHEAVKPVIGAATFTYLIFLALWWFRTYDSHQRDLRANFEAGVQHVASDTPIRIEIGTEILKNVSKTTSSYDREIRIAFIRRLKRFPATTTKNISLFKGGYRLSYAQHMLKWLQDQKDPNRKYDLNLLDIRYQEFASSSVRITVCEILDMHRGESLTLDLARCKFRSANEFFNSACNICDLWQEKDESLDKNCPLHTLRIKVGYEKEPNLLTAEFLPDGE